MALATERACISLQWNDPSTGEVMRCAAPLPITIGRDTTNTVVLNSGQVSRQHARLECVGDDLVLVDAGSTNGVFVNDARTERAVLDDGATFQIGPFSFVVDLDGVPQTPSATAITLLLRGPNDTVPHPLVHELPITLGRDATNDVVLGGNNVSRKHARIEQDGPDVVLTDSSSNGTFRNDERITRAVLCQGDTVRIGGFMIEVQLPQDDPTLRETTRPISDATIVEQLGAAALVFNPDTDRLVPQRATSEHGAFPPDLFAQPIIPMHALRHLNIPVDETLFLALGGGLGSFIWVDNLVASGVRPQQIMSIGLEPKPHGRYERLCRNSQIPLHERLRSNSDSTPDNIWGWPGYAVREVWQSLRHGDFGNAAKVTWQIFGEPTLAQTYTPRAGDVFRSIDREAQRIGWGHMWRYGRIRAIRLTDDGRYVVAYGQTRTDHGPAHRFAVANFVHLAVGYPGVRFLPDLQEYRERTNDFKGVVNAYEEHEHVYAQLQRQGGTVLIRGRGIVASRIIQRIYEVRQQNNNVSVLHLLRTPLAEGNRYGHAQREVDNHWEFQPFNWPKATWGGTLRQQLEQADDRQRDLLLNDWGGTTTADRRDWRDMIDAGLREGWYQIRFGEVARVERDPNGMLVTVIKGKGLQEESHLPADFIIDCTGMEARIDTNPLLKDMVEMYQLGRNPKGRLPIANDFEIAGMRNGSGRIYASGAMTLGGPYAAVDSFLGLQYAAQVSVDAIAQLNVPGLRRLNGLRSWAQWLRWARGVHP